MNQKFKSRKFIMSWTIIGLASVLPVIFTKFGIDSGITMMSIGVIGGVGAAYGVVNAIDKKWNGGA